MRIWITIISTLLLAAAGELVRELRCFQVTRYTVTSRKLSGLKTARKLIFLSDLHNYCYGKENEALFRAIAKEKPDLILVGGDMLLRKDASSYEHTVRFLSRLPAICPVYHANGNHEQKMKERPTRYKRSFRAYKRELEKAGIRFLENESVTVSWDGNQVRITGLEIPLRGYERWARNRIGAADIKKKIGKSKDVYEILLAHHPAHIQAYLDWGADLVLSGHYHGGVVRIPGIGGVVAPDFTFFPEYSGGCYRLGEAAAVVSKGLGVHSVPIRFFNPAEVVAVEISN